MTDKNVGALQMPSELGAEVNRVLGIHMLAGPVISFPVAQAWVFLTEAPSELDGVPDALAEWDVYQAPRGATLRLPLSHPAAGSIHWINEPGPAHPNPPWHAVIAATRRALASATAVLDEAS